MKLKKLFKVLDENTVITVLDLKNGVNAKNCTIEDFKKSYEKEVLERKITFIEVCPVNNAELLIEIY